MTDRYLRALEGLRERCAQEAERITARSRTLAAMMNAEAVKPCEVAAAIRKIDVQQECVKLESVRPGKHQHPSCSQAQPLTDEALLRQALEALEEACNALYEGHPIRVNMQEAIAALRERLNKKEPR